MAVARNKTDQRSFPTSLCASLVQHTLLHSRQTFFIPSLHHMYDLYDGTAFN